MNQSDYRQSVNRYYRQLAGHEPEPERTWYWNRVLRGYITYKVTVEPDRSN